MLIVSVSVVVPRTDLPKGCASIPAMEIVTISAGRKSASVAAKDELPAPIFTDLAALWISSSVTFIAEIVVIALDL